MPIRRRILSYDGFSVLLRKFSALRWLQAHLLPFECAKGVAGTGFFSARICIGDHRAANMPRTKYRAAERLNTPFENRLTSATQAVIGGFAAKSDTKARKSRIGS